MASTPTFRRVTTVLTTLVVPIVAMVAVVLATAPAASAAPKQKPTITSVMTQLGKLSRQAEQLSEQFNKASAEVKAKQKAAGLAVSMAHKARTNFTNATDELSASLIEQYRGSTFSGTSALISAGSTQQYVDQLTMLSMLSHQRAGISAMMKGAKVKADNAQQAAAKALTEAKARKAALAKQRATVQKQQSKYQTLLNTLTAAQRTTYFNKTEGKSPAPSTKWTQVPPPSKLAGIAVAFALKQLGKPYQWGAAGPGSYDCSGLTMAAWGAAGVHLSHYAPTQMTAGHRIAQSQLAPGDLVFFYPDIGHVGMYLGKGMMIHAPTTGDVVRIVPLSTFASDYQGAVRLP